MVINSKQKRLHEQSYSLLEKILLGYKYAAIIKLTILINLINMFILGPEVSLNGSPTVSPVTEALWASEPL